MKTIFNISCFVIILFISFPVIMNSCSNDWLYEEHTSYSARIYNSSAKILFIIYSTSSAGTDTTVLVPKTLSSYGGSSYNIFYMSVKKANAAAITPEQFRSHITSVQIYTLEAGDTTIYHPELDLSDINLWNYYINHDDFTVEHNYYLNIQ